MCTATETHRKVSAAHLEWRGTFKKQMVLLGTVLFVNPRLKKCCQIKSFCETHLSLQNTVRASFVLPLFWRPLTGKPKPCYVHLMAVPFSQTAVWVLGRTKWTLIHPRIGSISRIISLSGRKPRGGHNFSQVGVKFRLLSLKFSLSPRYSGGCGYSANMSVAPAANIKVKFLFDRFKQVRRCMRQEMSISLTKSCMSTVFEWPVEAVRK